MMETINKEEVLKHLKHLNETKYIDVNGQAKQRLIFINSDEVFNLFGIEEKGILTPFNDYTYIWFSGFLDNVINLIEYKHDSLTFDELEECIKDNMFEWIDSSVDIYTYNLIQWLGNNNDNIYYLTQALEEGEIKDGFKALQIAQYHAIEEIYNNSCHELFKHLKDKFNNE